MRKVALGSGWIVALVAVLVGWRGWVGRSCPGDEAAVPSGVAATVDERSIAWEDVELDVLASLAHAGIRYEGAEGEQRLAELRQGMRERAVERVLLEQEARRRGHQAEEARVREELDRLRAQVPEGTILRRLLKAGRLEDALRRRAEANVLLEAIFAEIRKQSAPSAAEIEAYYRGNPDRFREPEAAFFRQIVVGDRAIAAEVARRLRAGESIEQLGQQHAPQRTGFERGAGELRMFRGNRDPREPVLFRVRPGEVSDPVELPEGFAVLRLERRTPPRQVAFDEARGQIEKTLATQKFNDAVQQLGRGLRDRAQIVRSPLPGPQAPAPAPSPAQNP